MAREDLAEARALAAWLGVEHVVVETAETDNPAYQANAGNRCYFCKQELFFKMADLARSRGASQVMYGAIGDDQASERPGQRAALEQGVVAPLQEAGMSKADVRELARALGLPNWDRPQNACLSSRVPLGQRVTAAKLSQIEEAESAVRREGFRQVRVRHLGAHARIEVDPDEVFRFQEPALRARIGQKFQALGFGTVAVARAGYQPGGADRRGVDEVPLDAMCAC
jgi:uncharacterized protein